MNLVIDLGNTQSKAAIFNENSLLDRIVFDVGNLQIIKELFNKYPIKKSIISSVTDQSIEVENFLKSQTNTILFTHKLELPITIKYKSPESLGADRLANVVSAYYLFPNKNVLVIDVGTCIKMDILTSNKEYFGGSIAPGLQMRFKALNSYTAKLPLVQISDFNKLYGSNTEESISAGVLTATIVEVNGMIELYQDKYENLQIILTGGDASFFESKLNYSIFVEPNLLLKGLNTIITHA